MYTSPTNLCTPKQLFAISCFFLFVTTANSYGQTAVFRNAVFPVGSILPGAIPEKTLDLSSPGGSVIGKVWFEQWANGLLAFGRGTGLHSPWARSPLEMDSRTHVKLWLALADAVAMPDIGWGNQFGEQTCATYDASGATRPGVESCPDWEARQVAYREQFRRLFLRQWEMGPHISAEVLATPAFGEVLRLANGHDLPALAKFEPSRSPILDDASDGFQIFIPWSSLPPAASLDLSHFFTVVEIWDGKTAVASTAPNHRADEPTTYNRLELGHTLHSSITPCEYGLTETNIYGVSLPAWYFPSSNTSVADTFALTNEAGGYRYDPEGLSPIPFWKHYFSIRLGNANTVCGPDLRYVAGKPWSFDAQINEDHLKYLKLADGSYLLRSGPTFRTYSPFGNGRCGACAVVQEEVYRLKPDTGVSKVFSESIRMDPPTNVDLDIQFSADWKTIHVYQANGDTGNEVWLSRQYCYSGETYEPCGEPGSTPPPKPRQINLDGAGR